jgi:hypothetical protein
MHKAAVHKASALLRAVDVDKAAIRSRIMASP